MRPKVVPLVVAALLLRPCGCTSYHCFFLPFCALSVLRIFCYLQPTQGIIDATGNERFAYDTYRRFLNMYSDVVMELDKEPFEEVRSMAQYHINPSRALCLYSIVCEQYDTASYCE